jgi:hypothetical protein
MQFPFGPQSVIFPASASATSCNQELSGLETADHLFGIDRRSLDRQKRSNFNASVIYNGWNRYISYINSIDNFNSI